MKKVTVAMRTYNSAAFVRNALQSVLDQSVSPENFEVFVLDDGSTDNTVTIVRGIAEGSDVPVRVFENEHIGPMPAINMAFRKAETPYVTFVDSDDKVEPDLLKRLLCAVEEHEDPNTLAFAHCDYHEHGKDGTSRIKSAGDDIFKSLFGGLLFNREALIEVGLLDEDLILPEYCLFFRLLAEFDGRYHRVHVPHALYHYKRRAGSITDSRDRVERALAQLTDKYGKTFPIHRVRSYE